MPCLSRRQLTHLLLHDLLERGQRQHLSLGQCHVLAEVLLEGGLGSLAAAANRLGLAPHVGAGGVGVVPARRLKPWEGAR